MNSLSAMHFLPQTRHDISDFDCFSYYTLALVEVTETNQLCTFFGFF